MNGWVRNRLATHGEEHRCCECGDVRGKMASRKVPRLGKPYVVKFASCFFLTTTGTQGGLEESRVTSNALAERLGVRAASCAPS